MDLHDRSRAPRLPLLLTTLLLAGAAAAQTSTDTLEAVREGRPWIPATSTMATVDGAPALEDAIALPFVQDDAVPGEWVVVDVVADTFAFRPEEQIWQENVFDLVEARFDPGGAVTLTLATATRVDTWTRGHLLHDGSLRTDSPYTLSTVGKEHYMFLQWKTDDYSRRFQRPAFYVLRKL